MNEQIKHLRLDWDDLTLSPQFMLRNIDLEIGEAEVQGNPRLRVGSSDTTHPLCLAHLFCTNIPLRHSKIAYRFKLSHWEQQPMSALGHKRTFCDTEVMSALGPKADMPSA
ncbi:MAG: hypothetical protein WCC54_14360, partial [Pseudolabrys sp.]